MIQTTPAKNLNGTYKVDGTAYRLLQFLVDSGFVLDRISYDALKGQVFSEKVTVVGNRKEWEVPTESIRGYRNPSPVDEFQVDIETVMKDIVDNWLQPVRIRKTRP
jgi:hypothetical protein